MKTRNLLWQVPLIIAVLSPLWWGIAADFLNPQKLTRVNKVKTEKNFNMDGVTLVQSKNGKEEFLLNADRVASKNVKKELSFEKVQAFILDGKEKVAVTSNEAIYDTEKQIITLLSDVRLKTGDGYNLNTNVLRYFTKYRKAKSAAPVEFTGDNVAISGKSFYYDLNTGNFRVGKRVYFNLW